MGNAIGNTAKRTSRFVKRFNIENRVNKVLDREKPDVAPRHETTSKLLEEFAADNPELFEEQKKKNLDLHERLKQVRLESTGSLPEIKSRRLPERNRLNEPTISGYRGFLDPEKVPEGKLTLKNAMRILTKVQETPDLDSNAVKNIAKEYKLDLLQVQQLLRHFKALEMKFPDSLQQKHPSLAEDLKRRGQKGVDDWVSGVRSDAEAIEFLKDESRSQAERRRERLVRKAASGIPGDEDHLEGFDWKEPEKELNTKRTDKQMPLDKSKKDKGDS
ncbi:NADH dehydrogenase [ubiquinone] 1 alpha subcomplex assembly factor 4-like [Ylistrum balloti]|uniref:NADH dehydrogenase [ubiquinone] 1 alpha subcomplex assembly factor 4-like n=1 Tax=Ylistrum balloti TaxID=509963 RepID=UPI0029059E09|nr:NADH dehydrogenase [ubiquinone] 1 alpha subcomplex assembly factor 4-like [Ylistrum balloti]